MLNLSLDAILLSTIIGIMGGLLGIFYRNCLIAENMIFNWLYRIFCNWVASARILGKNRILGFIAYPLGYCIYCSTTWITIILYFLLTEISVWIILALGVQHLVVILACKFLIKDNNDLSSNINEEIFRVIAGE